MRGHIRERSPGRWAIILDVPDPVTGKRRRKWHAFKGMKREAQKECARLITEIQGGSYLEPSKLTVGGLLDRWIGHMIGQISPRTHERYAEMIRTQIKPAVGGMVLTRLRPAHISTAYSAALMSGRRDGKGGLAPTSVIYIHRILKQALAQAVKWELLLRNPADAVDPPKAERTMMTTFDLGQTADLLGGLEGSRLRVPVMLGALCGLRRGEIVALRWGNVDLVNGRLAIVQSAEQTKAGIRYKPPKSGKGRVVALSATMAQELRAHRVRQAQELLKLGIGLSDSMFVYTREDGEPLQPRSLTQAWRKISSNLPRIRFHDLRHAHATHLLGSGVHPKIASERLGHSRIGITLDLYSHVLPGMQEEAVARVDDALQLALQRRPRDVG